jgi:hypothetical protein
MDEFRNLSIYILFIININILSIIIHKRGGINYSLIKPLLFSALANPQHILLTVVTVYAGK